VDVAALGEADLPPVGHHRRPCRGPRSPALVDGRDRRYETPTRGLRFEATGSPCIPRPHTLQGTRPRIRYVHDSASGPLRAIVLGICARAIRARRAPLPSKRDNTTSRASLIGTNRYQFGAVWAHARDRLTSAILAPLMHTAPVPIGHTKGRDDTGLHTVLRWLGCTYRDARWPPEVGTFCLAQTHITTLRTSILGVRLIR
jgi:hypothetical protein